MLQRLNIQRMLRRNPPLLRQCQPVPHRRPLPIHKPTQRQTIHDSHLACIRIFT
ncbi:hypothetical protein J9253_05845 [Thiothrix litoralis]|uniref:Uncharacterized protein n=1 Tax=Thiothrix litoralis TaxID=2891210 RepID=A0ABX7WUF2_9GAMM|nr:hypothetical protein [Thiothrix litoralis]QTR47454.1 hypothetical protein J9253_05845 [Thiothrix litoralis]